MTRLEPGFNVGTLEDLRWALANGFDLYLKDVFIEVDVGKKTVSISPKKPEPHLAKANQ